MNSLPSGWVFGLSSTSFKFVSTNLSLFPSPSPPLNWMRKLLRLLFDLSEATESARDGGRESSLPSNEEPRASGAGVRTFLKEGESSIGWLLALAGRDERAIGGGA